MASQRSKRQLLPSTAWECDDYDGADRTPRRAFGLTIVSEIDLLELPEAGPDDATDPDVRIIRGRFDEAAAEHTDERIERITQNHYRLNYATGPIDIVGGDTVVIDPVADVDHEILRHVILGPVMNHLLHQRGRMVLHASTVVIGDRAVAFLGQSGSGKTTTAAACLAAGHTVLSDDVALVVDERETVTVEASFPAIKLHDDLPSRLDLPIDPPERVSSLRDRHFRRIRMEQPSEPVPLACVYLLAESPTERVESLSPAEQVTTLIEHTYTAPLLRVAEEAEANFARCSDIASSVPVKRLHRPKQFDRLDRLVETVEDDLGG